MKICFVAGPGSIHTQRWAAWFVDRGHEVHVIFPHSFLRPSAFKIDGAVMHPVPTTPVFFKSSHLLLLPIDHFRLKRLISEIRPDVLHAHYVRDYGFRAAETGFHPLVVTVWGSDVLVDPVRNRLVRWEVSRTLRKADMITCATNHIMAKVRMLSGPQASIRNVGFGIDTQLFAPSVPDCGLKARLGLSDKRVIVSTRAFRHVYDIPTIISSMPALLAKVPDATLLLVGEGPLEPTLREMAVSLNIADAVRFVGRVANNQLPSYLSIAEAYVSASLSDGGLPVSATEAMACGLPVVISDFGDNREWVHSGGGHLFPCGDHEALADRLIDVLTTPQMAVTAKNVNRKTVLERCDRDTELTRMESYYRELLNGRVA